MRVSEVYEISKDKLDVFLGQLRKNYELIAPVKRYGVHSFKKVDALAEIDLNYINTEYSPKKFFLPPNEVLFSFDTKGNVVENKSFPKLAIFGIRSCDLHAINRMDLFFSDKFKDSNYLGRRASSLLLALECSKAGENCFCESVDASQPIGYDLLFSERKNKFLVHVGSKNGKKLISSLFKKSKEKIIPRISCTKKIHEARDWKISKWAERCLSCAACTTVCPTCSCFSTFDDMDLDGKYVRRRDWDYCFLPSFTTVHGNFCFRQPRDERLKQFVFHKFKYFKERYGKQQCVGCGRCVSVCVAKIDISKIVSGELPGD